MVTIRYEGRGSKHERNQIDSVAQTKQFRVSVSRKWNGLWKRTTLVEMSYAELRIYIIVFSLRALLTCAPRQNYGRVNVEAYADDTHVATRVDARVHYLKCILFIYHPPVDSPPLSFCFVLCLFLYVDNNGNFLLHANSTTVSTIAFHRSFSHHFYEE